MKYPSIKNKYKLYINNKMDNLRKIYYKKNK